MKRSDSSILNRDELIRTPLRASYTGMKDLWLPRTVLEADFLVSMPKIKAHHWSGVTLSMKNMFGVVPGARYGWPKNILHWKGIQESILDLCATVPIRFVIADGIVAMEGNGPLNGTARALGKIVLADDPVAADATCARLMGFHPERVSHIREGSRFLGNASPALIDQVGEIVVSADEALPGGPGVSTSLCACDASNLFAHMRRRRGGAVASTLVRNRAIDLEHAKPYWNYEDIGVFFLVLVLLGSVLRFLVRFRLLQRSELTDPSFGLQFAVVASLSLALYLVLKFRHHQPVLQPLGWVWPRTAYVVVALMARDFLASGVALYLRFRNQSTPP